jgi:hypothetical protein
MSGSPGRTRLAALLACALIAGCARRAPPSGGPPDLVPPGLVSSVPDSGAAGVPLDGALSLTFTEGMEPRSTQEAVSLAPRVAIAQRRWKGRTLTLIPAEALKDRQTYTLIVGTTAADRHGNPMETGAAIPFSTADSFPPGRLEGEIQPVGFTAAGTYLWVYEAGRSPDSTARDFDAVGVTDMAGRFRISGLPVPRSYRLWGFADLNRNRSFEPDVDVLAPADTAIELVEGAPSARGLVLHMVNPRAPGRVRGAVIDSTGDTLGVIRIVATAEIDTTIRIMFDVDPQAAFDLKLQAGVWLLRAFRDDDHNRAWRTDVEPASPVQRVRLSPGADVQDVRLRLVRLFGGP